MRSHRSIFLLSAVVALAACGPQPEAQTSPQSSVSIAASSAVPVASASSSASAASSGVEQWTGSIALKTENRDIVIAFDSPTSGTFTSALLKGKTIPLSDVKVEEKHIHFALGKGEIYDLDRQGDSASGAAQIGPEKCILKLVKLKAGEAPHGVKLRPQTPEGPFPYEEREVTVDAPDGGKLAGTLTLPKGATGPVPAILLWSGSGQEDRDETVFGHKPFLVLADHFTRAGIAVLRLDDRATGKTVGAVGTLHTEVDDASAAIAFLGKQKEIDPKKIGMLGHSTGGMVLVGTATKTKSLAFLVSLAGVAIPGSELVPMQLEIGAKAHGMAEADYKDGIALQKKVGAAVKNGEKAVRAVLEPAMGKGPDLDKAVAALMNPWTVSYFTIDPRDDWKKIEVPALVIVGEKDTQVPADPTIKAVEGAVSKTEKARLTTQKMPGLNHLFQHAISTGLDDEYPQIDETFDPGALDVITDWLKKQ